MSTKELVERIDALYAKAGTQVEWRPLRTRIDGADGYQIMHSDLHGKTEGESLANLRLVATLVNTWPEIRELLAKGDGAQGVVVPREPTDEMRRAMRDAIHPYCADNASWLVNGWAVVSQAYRAAIAYAPPVERDDSKGETR